MDAPLQTLRLKPFLTLFQEDAASLRVFRRFSLDCPITVGVLGSKPPVRGTAAKPSAMLTNASMSGLCFSSRDEFPEDTLVVAEIELYRHLHRVPVVVRRCVAHKKLGRVFYECGAQYVKSDATFLFLPLMAHYLRHQAPEF